MAKQMKMQTYTLGHPGYTLGTLGYPGSPWVHPGPPLMHREGKLLDIGSHARKTLNDNVVIFSSDILIHFELFYEDFFLRLMQLQVFFPFFRTSWVLLDI